MIDAHTHCQGSEHIGDVLHGDTLPVYEREFASGRRRPLDWGPSDFPHYTPTDGASGLHELEQMRRVGLPHIAPDTVAHHIESDHLETLGLR